MSDFKTTLYDDLPPHKKAFVLVTFFLLKSPEFPSMLAGASSVAFLWLYSAGLRLEALAALVVAGILANVARDRVKRMTRQAMRLAIAGFGGLMAVLGGIEKEMNGEAPPASSAAPPSSPGKSQKGSVSPDVLVVLFCCALAVGSAIATCFGGR